MTSNKLILGDCLTEMPKLEEASIDLTVTSPPYDNLRTYNNSLEWGEHIWKRVIEDLFWLTKEGGVVAWVVGDATIDGSETGTSFKQALWAMECGFRLNDTMIYKKNNPMPQFSQPRYTNSFEFMFVWSKGKPKTVNYIREECRSAGRVDKKYKGQRFSSGVHNRKERKVILDTKILQNVWEYDQNNGVEKSVNHPAQFPVKLAHDHIISWSNPGDVVLDCFMGSGTTGSEAKKLHRHFIGIEKDPEYFKISQKRIAAAQPALF